MNPFFTHTLVDYDASTLCLACRQLPPVEECGPNYAHEIHNSLQELEACQCPFCEWLWKAILHKSGGIESGPMEWIKEREEPIELHINLLDNPPNACLLERNCMKTIIPLPLYAFPGMFIQAVLWLQTLTTSLCTPRRPKFRKRLC